VTRRRRTRRRGQRGLTLIELILTLSILAIAGTLVSGALTTALRAWQSGFAAGREDLMARIVLERVSAQLRAVVSSPARREGAEAVAFDAGEGRLRFVSLAAAGQTPTQVSYTLEESPDGRHLVYREYPWPDKDFFGEHRARREEQVPGISGFAVSVTRRADEETGGDPSLVEREWKPTDGALPVKVAVELTLGGGAGAEPRSYRIEVPLPTQGAP
jgi:prepilin-type N-terminal cleavage/methylation domain-containing protein